MRSGRLSCLHGLSRTVYAADWQTVKVSQDKRRCPRYEDDISAKEKTESESSRLQSQNEYSRRKKSVSCQKSKRKSKIICLMNQAASDCGLFFSEYFLFHFSRSGCMGHMPHPRQAPGGQAGRFHEKISFNQKEQRFPGSL